MIAELPNFDTLLYLARHDPARLERLRRVLTERLISRAPERARRRLRGLQFEIDARIGLAPNPIAACVTLSGMMHDSFSHLADTLNHWQDDTSPPLATPAAILPFRPRQNDSSRQIS